MNILGIIILYKYVQNKLCVCKRFSLIVLGSRYLIDVVFYHDDVVIEHAKFGSLQLHIDPIFKKVFLCGLYCSIQNCKNVTIYILKSIFFFIDAGYNAISSPNKYNSHRLYIIYNTSRLYLFCISMSF